MSRLTRLCYSVRPTPTFLTASFLIQLIANSRSSEFKGSRFISSLAHLAYSLTITHSLTHHSLTHSLTHSLNRAANNIDYEGGCIIPLLEVIIEGRLTIRRGANGAIEMFLTLQPGTHSLTHSLTDSLTHSLTYYYSLTHSLTRVQITAISVLCCPPSFRPQGK